MNIHESPKKEAMAPHQIYGLVSFFPLCGSPSHLVGVGHSLLCS